MDPQVDRHVLVPDEADRDVLRPRRPAPCRARGSGRRRGRRCRRSSTSRRLASSGCQPSSGSKKRDGSMSKPAGSVSKSPVTGLEIQTSSSIATAPISVVRLPSTVTVSWARARVGIVNWPISAVERERFELVDVDRCTVRSSRNSTLVTSAIAAADAVTTSAASAFGIGDGSVVEIDDLARSPFDVPLGSRSARGRLGRPERERDRRRRGRPRRATSISSANSTGPGRSPSSAGRLRARLRGRHGWSLVIGGLSWSATGVRTQNSGATGGAGVAIPQPRTAVATSPHRPSIPGSRRIESSARYITTREAVPAYRSIESIGELVPPADDGEVLEHLVGDGVGHRGEITLADQPVKVSVVPSKPRSSNWKA